MIVILMIIVFIFRPSKVFLAILYHIMKNRYPKAKIAAQSSGLTSIDKISSQIFAYGFILNISIESANVEINAFMIFRMIWNILINKHVIDIIELYINKTTIIIQKQEKELLKNQNSIINPINKNQENETQINKEPDSTEKDPQFEIQEKQWPFIAPYLSDYIIKYTYIPIFVCIFGETTHQRHLPISERIHMNFNKLQYTYMEEQEQLNLSSMKRSSVDHMKLIQEISQLWGDAGATLRKTSQLFDTLRKGQLNKLVDE
ncbi:MAG: hypothetical protein EZS28_013875 [Streblomastix strix]|uniref:Uncharacterized protein n=1 Tax=Streblomastix strix TaxID=222440 RepID=A0A5J4W7F9_9EUKA|nr:MAG: hypothetical protein EZS28_013875 [Streblomastix strix]